MREEGRAISNRGVRGRVVGMEIVMALQPPKGVNGPCVYGVCPFHDVSFTIYKAKETGGTCHGDDGPMTTS